MTAQSSFRIPLARPREQADGIGAELDEAIQRVRHRAVFGPDEQVEDLEREFASYIGAHHAVAVSSGGAALMFALLSLGIKPGDEVISVANVDLSASAPITHAGGRLVWADIDDRSYVLDPGSLERWIGPRTRAIVVVHMYGNPADLDAIMDIAQAHGLAVVEDTALAVGARYRGRPVGGLANIGCFSFSPTKPLGAFGEAGMIVTNDADLAARARLFSDHGYTRASIAAIRKGQPGAQFEYAVEGFNGVMDELQAAVLRVKLRHLNDWIERRRAHDARYRRLLADLEPDCLLMPCTTPGAAPAPRNFVIRCRLRDQLMWHLAGQSIATSLAYVPPLHLQAVYSHLGYGRGSLRCTERVADELLGLPLLPELADFEIDEVCESIHAFFESARVQRLMSGITREV